MHPPQQNLKGTKEDRASQQRGDYVSPSGGASFGRFVMIVLFSISLYMARIWLNSLVVCFRNLAVLPSAPACTPHMETGGPLCTKTCDFSRWSNRKNTQTSPVVTIPKRCCVP